MKNKMILFGVIAVATLMMTSAVLAVKPNGPSAQNGLTKGKSVEQHLYLYQKCPAGEPCPWYDSTLWGSAWGKLTFKDTADGKFVFNGHKVEKKTDYTLIYYPDPWPGNGLICIGTGTTNKGGNVNIKGTFDFDTIPIEADTNEGAKIWLVLSSDVDCGTEATQGKMVGWNPTKYLFEYQLI